MKSVACFLLLIFVLGQNFWLPPTFILAILLQNFQFLTVYFYPLLPYIWQLGVAMWLNESIVCDFQNVFLRRGLLFACCLPFYCMDLVVMTGMPAFILGNEDQGHMLEMAGPGVGWSLCPWWLLGAPIRALDCLLLDFVCGSEKETSVLVWSLICQCLGFFLCSRP